MIDPGTRELSDAFRRQATICLSFGSPLYGELLRRAADDLDCGGPIARLVRSWRGEPLRDALALRLMGGVHELVLAGRAPTLAVHYPSTGGSPRWPRAWSEFVAVVEAHAQPLRSALDRPPQTNEVRRSAILLGGFLTAARRSRGPIALRELGASAGLNLLWDRYRYHLGPHARGPADAGLTLHADWRGAPPPPDTAVSIHDRRGCDLHPLSAAAERDRLALDAFVWPGNEDRRAVLRSALATAAQDPPTIDRAPATEWLAPQIEAQRERPTAVFHSVFWPYLSDSEQADLHDQLRGEGARRAELAPLFWLRLEDAGDPGEPMELRLTTWPGEHEQLLARAQPHGAWVEWITPEQSGWSAS